MRHVVVTGGTGLIGAALCRKLLRGAYRITVLTRGPARARQRFKGLNIDSIAWGRGSPGTWREVVAGADAVINLAGERIAGLWTKQKRRAILESRTRVGHAVADAIVSASEKPRVLIQASAVGFYGNRQDEVIDENAAVGDGFVADVVRQWEATTMHVEASGIRRVIIRTGMVLSSEGGSLPLFSIPFRLFVGGPMGSGKQWMPWIHVDDEVRAIRFLLESEDFAGVFNLVSPNPVTNHEFGKTLGHVMGRPSWFPVPAIVLKTLLGAMAGELLLSSQRAIPERLLRAGFLFQFPTLEGSLNEIMNR